MERQGQPQEEEQWRDSRHTGKLADTQEAMPDARVLRNDASDPSAADALADSVAGHGGLDGLLLNAGYAAVADVGQVDADFFDRMINTNARGPVLQLARLWTT